jgi:hypothetical protein
MIFVDKSTGRLLVHLSCDAHNGLFYPPLDSICRDICKSEKVSL